MEIRGVKKVGLPGRWKRWRTRLLGSGIAICPPSLRALQTLNSQTRHNLLFFFFPRLRLLPTYRRPFQASIICQCVNSFRNDLAAAPAPGRPVQWEGPLRTYRRPFQASAKGECNLVVLIHFGMTSSRPCYLQKAPAWDRPAWYGSR